jgi:hypothetical protein
MISVSAAFKKRKRSQDTKNYLNICSSSSYLCDSIRAVLEQRRRLAPISAYL